jgi:hypothetical protein
VPADLLFDDGVSGVPLRRQSLGEYSWLITIGPQYTPDQEYASTSFPGSNYLATGLDPRLAHRVSVVVFHKRNLLFPTGSETELNEREVIARFVSPGGPSGGEVLLRTDDPRELEGLRPGEWLMLFGQYEPSGRWFMGWYRIVTMDLGYDDLPLDSSPAGVREGSRIVSLKGPQWPWTVGQSARAGLFSGIIAVHTKTMPLESKSAWSIPTTP